MRKILAVAATCGALFAACGGVDREGTRDELIESIEAAGGTADADCVDKVFDTYSDDELESIDDELEDNPSEPSAEATELFNQLFECITVPTS